MDPKQDLTQSIDTTLERHFNLPTGKISVGTYTEGLANLKTQLGLHLTAEVLGVGTKHLNQWAKEDGIKPSQWQLRVIDNAIEVIGLARTVLTAKEVKEWLQEPNWNLANLSPARVLAREPAMVRDEAMRLASGRVIWRTQSS